MIVALEARIKAIRDRAIAYYTNARSETSGDDESHLKHEMQSIVAAVALLRYRKPKHYKLDHQVMELRKAVTGSPFEHGDRAKLAHNDIVVHSLWLQSDALIDGLKEEFEKANEGY